MLSGKWGLVVVALCLGAWAAQGVAQDRPRPITEDDRGGFIDPGMRPPGYPGVPVQPTPDSVSVTGEYQEMVTLLKFTKTQEKALNGILLAEQKALANFDKQNDKKLNDLRQKLTEAKNEVAEAAIQRQIDLILANRQRLQDSFKRRVMGLFTVEQKATWVTYKLTQMMTEEFSVAGLSEEQSLRMRAVCQQAGQAAKTADVVNDKDLVTAVKQQILSAVLTPEQRLRYAEALRARAAAAAGTG